MFLHLIYPTKIKFKLLKLKEPKLTLHLNELRANISWMKINQKGILRVSANYLQHKKIFSLRIKKFLKYLFRLWVVDYHKVVASTKTLIFKQRKRLKRCKRMLILSFKNSKPKLKFSKKGKLAWLANKPANLNEKRLNTRQ